MEKDKLIEIAKDVENQPNQVLIDSRDFLYGEFEKTKKLIIDLSRHMDAIEKIYDNINNEIGKRIK